jgi:RNA polymerase sigma-70 factor (ECF subfamily)
MTCTRAIEKAHLFQPGTHLDRWLFVMARRLWLNELRANNLQSAQSVDDMDIADNSAPAETNIFAREVLHEVNTLPEAQRAAALLVFVEGYKYAEAAEILDIPVGTIMSRISAARATLATRLADVRGADK